MITYEKIVLGSCLNAILYAFNNSCPIFFTTPQRPHRFDYFDPDMDLSCLQLGAAPKSLTTPDGPKLVGQSKELLWERLLFLLSIDGKVPLSNLCHTIRYDNERVVCSNEYSKIMEFNFKQCVYFGDDNASGFARQKTLDEDTYICYDYVAFNRGGKHEVDYMYTGDDFVSEIWFYSSDRIDGNSPVRDACAVSKLTAEQLLDFDYSQTMARFKTVHEMEKRGMKGTFAHDYTKAGKPKHYKFRTTSIRRETHKRRDQMSSESENVEIATRDSQALYQALPKASLAYDRFLRNL